MNFYVPELGDEIVLSEDWSFNLHAEGRNAALGAFFGYYLLWHYVENTNNHENWVHESAHPIEGQPKMPPTPYKDPNYTKIHENYLKELNAWVLSTNPVISLPVTLKKGTILKIDRLYIRKGVGDYSSITFYAKNVGEVQVTPRWGDKTKKKKAKALRFWAKLDECNKIIFDK